MITVLCLPINNKEILEDFKNKTIEQLIDDYGFKFKPPLSIRATRNPHGNLEPPEVFWQLSDLELDLKLERIMVEVKK